MEGSAEEVLEAYGSQAEAEAEAPAVSKDSLN
jgi:hypothetical protein